MLISFQDTFWTELGPTWPPKVPKMTPRWLPKCPKIAPRRLPGPRGSWRRFFSLLKIVLNFASFWVRFWSIWVPKWSPKWEDDSALRGLEVDLFLACYLCHILVASKTAQEAPKRPQEAPRPPQDRPRGAQETPRPPQERPKRLQEAAKSAPGGSKKASRASKLNPRCPAKSLPATNAQNSGAGGGVPPSGKAIRRHPKGRSVSGWISKNSSNQRVQPGPAQSAPELGFNFLGPKKSVQNRSKN